MTIYQIPAPRGREPTLPPWTRLPTCLSPISWTLRHLIKTGSSWPHWPRQRWGISHNHEVELALHSSQIMDELYSVARADNFTDGYTGLPSPWKCSTGRNVYWERLFNLSACHTLQNASICRHPLPWDPRFGGVWSGRRSQGFIQLGSDGDAG